MLLAGTALGYGLSFLSYPDVEDSPKFQNLQIETQRFRTYLTCIPPSHEEEEVTPDTWVHYNYDEEGNLMMIEIETTQKQDSPAWGYLPQGHPGMEFEHWALHIWFQDPEEVCLDLESLIEKLRGKGLIVERTGEIDQPFFQVKGQLISVNGDTLQIFAYDDLHSANNEAALVSPDGRSVGNTMVQWVATPHFYQTGKLIVIYVGDDENMEQTFEEIIGFQFAGG